MSTPHRWWRIAIASTTDNSYATLTNVVMSTTPGGTNLIGSGTASAQNDFGSPYVPSAAATTNLNDFWLSGGGIPVWWQYDFGTPVDIWEVQISATTFTTYNELPHQPNNWSLQYSDDGTTFTTLKAFFSGVWSVGSTQVFQVSAAGSGRAFFII
jgi:hypothetical protein